MCKVFGDIRYTLTSLWEVGLLNTRSVIMVENEQECIYLIKICITLESITNFLIYADRLLDMLPFEVKSLLISA